MRSIAIVAALCAAVVFPRSASADSSVEISAGGSFGGAAIELADPSDGSTTRTWSVNASGRVRRPENTPFGLEVALHVPHGVSATVLLDIARVKRLGSAHLAVGVFRPIDQAHMSVTKLDRSWDLVLGWGLEARVYKKWEATLDWRVFLPDPSTVPRTYGDFSRPFYDEALRGGQLWLGMQRPF